MTRQQVEPVQLEIEQYSMLWSHPLVMMLHPADCMSCIQSHEYSEQERKACSVPAMVDTLLDKAVCRPVTGDQQQVR